MFKFGAVSASPFIAQTDTCYTILSDAYFDSTPITTCKLFVGGSVGNGLSEMNFNQYSSLEFLVVSGSSFVNVRTFCLCGLTSLRVVSIGRNSFRSSSSRRSDGRCEIKDCPRLELIDFGYCAFQDYATLELEELPELKKLRFDQNCFQYTNDFSLEGMR